MNQKGFIALITVFIIAAIALLVAISASLFSTSETDMGSLTVQSTESYYLADACAEYALRALGSSLSYTGNETLALGSGSCYVYPPEGSGNTNRVIKTTGTLNNLTRKVKINITKVRPRITISSWQEVNNF